MLFSFLTMFWLFHSDVLALPIFKQEDSSLPPENETKNPPFQYVLCAATSPAVKLHDETLTYLNQGERFLKLYKYTQLLTCHYKNIFATKDAFITFI